MHEAPLTLLTGETTHKRFVPFEQHFKYKLFMIDIDIDRLDEAGSVSPLFSVNGPGLFSFADKDHGARGACSLREWADAKFDDAGVDLEGGAIRLTTFPRHMFYKFAPISLWFGYDQNGAVKGVIYEVKNTFGETHSYVAAAASNEVSRHEADKVFHVSPFFDVSGQYRFTLRPPDKGVNLVVDSVGSDTRTHMATIQTRRMPASSTNFVKTALSQPFSSLGVTAGIHWEALKLWLKGAKYHSKPTPPSNEATVAIGKTKEPAA